MTATTTTRPPARTPFSSHSHLPRTSHRTSSTPSGLPARTPASVGQPNPPALTPSSQRAPQTPSPNYFGLVVEPGRSNPADSNAGEQRQEELEPAAPLRYDLLPPTKRRTYRSRRTQISRPFVGSRSIASPSTSVMEISRASVSGTELLPYLL